jgi:hypothetical protein
MSQNLIHHSLRSKPMVTRTRILLAAAFALAVGGATIAHSQPARPAATWEFREIQLSAGAPSTPLMNSLGAEGWELVNVVSACNGKSVCAWWAYFKRRS